MSMLVTWEESDYPNFKPTEFMCRCGCGNILVDEDLLEILTFVRKQLGVPIIINSGYRCVKHNKAVGGHPNSYHTQGKAADIHVAPPYWAKLINLVLENGIDRIGFYLSPYDTLKWIHIDVGPKPTPAVWFKTFKK